MCMLYTVFSSPTLQAKPLPPSTSAAARRRSPTTLDERRADRRSSSSPSPSASTSSLVVVEPRRTPVPSTPSPSASASGLDDEPLQRPQPRVQTTRMPPRSVPEGHHIGSEPVPETRY